MTLSIIGGGKSGIKGSVRGKAIWKLETLTNAFKFYIPNLPDRELFVEHDELAAAGPAYDQKPPLNILDVLDKLEELAPDFHGIQISEKIMLIRKRLQLSQGLHVNGRENIFMKDETLKTINFLDFYDDFLKPDNEGEHGENF